MTARAEASDPPEARQTSGFPMGERSADALLSGSIDVVGTAGLEPATSASRTLRATKLRYVP